MKRYKFTVISIFIALIFSSAALAVENGEYSNPMALVSHGQLEKMIADNAVKVIDVRGGAKYRLGHIAGAVNISVLNLDVEKNGMTMMLPDTEKFAKVMGENGIANDNFVVIYEDGAGYQSARLAWAFMQFGHSKVALLDGPGSALKGKTDVDRPSVTPSVFVARDDGKLIASIDDVKAALGKAEFVILDTRSLGEYTGETPMEGAGKGHIPGAVHIDWLDNMNENKAIKSAAELKKMYEARGVTPDKTIIAYCHVGYRAAFSAYVLKKLLGYPNVIMYDGSWLEWSAASAPVEE
jgi:thiosulfate/3-mercaptopyruvate sulfurtransferase